MNTRTRLLGVDTGSVRIGLAVSDPERKIAFPLATYERRDRERDAAYFRQLVEDEEIAELIVGLPLHLDGREGQKAAEARTFGQWLSELTQRPAIFWDERFSSAAADVRLLEAGLVHTYKDSRRDMLAAQAILQSFLDAADRRAMPTDRR